MFIVIHTWLVYVFCYSKRPLAQITLLHQLAGQAAEPAEQHLYVARYVFQLRKKNNLGSVSEIVSYGQILINQISCG